MDGLGKSVFMDGYREGYEQGRKARDEALMQLVQILLKENRIDEIDRVTRNEEYLTEVLKKYDLI